MKAAWLNRIGIILNCVAGFLLAPELIGLERLRKIERFLENWDRHRFAYRLERVFRFVESIIKQFFSEFSFSRVEEVNLIRWIVVSLLFIVIPSIFLALFGLLKIYELAQTSNVFGGAFVVAFIIYITGMISKLEPSLFLAVPSFLYHSIVILLSLFLFLPIVIILSVFASFHRGNIARIGMGEIFQKVQEKLSEVLLGFSAIVLVLWLFPVILPIFGIVRLLGVFPIIFYKFVKSFIHLLEPSDSRLKSLLVSLGISFFILGNFLQFIATF